MKSCRSRTKEISGIRFKRKRDTTERVINKIKDEKSKNESGEGLKCRWRSAGEVIGLHV